MSTYHLLSFYGTDDPDDGYARRQEHLHRTAAEFGGIQEQHPWNHDQLKQTDFYSQHRQILDNKRGAGFWLWKPYLLLRILQQIPGGDFLMYHDVGRVIRRDPNIGYRFTRSIEPLADWAERHDGFFPGIYVPTYGPSRRWTKRDCFVLMDCDTEPYWNQPQVQAGINIWQNNSKVREFISEWLEYCKDPRILTDQENQCGKPDHVEFQDHRHDQSVLTNLLTKRGIEVYGKPHQETFKQRDVGYITKRVVTERLLREDNHALERIAEEFKSLRVARGTLAFYQLHMEERRDEPVRLLEICDRPRAESAMWDRYFSNAEVHALYPGAPAKNQQAPGRTGLVEHSIDPSHRPSLEIFCSQMQRAGTRFDYIIEFGSGLMRDQQLAVGTLFRLLKSGGYFFIEQLERAVKPGLGDLNIKMSNSTLELIRRINLPQYRVNSHYFSVREARELEQIADSAGVGWYRKDRSGVAMIQRSWFRA